MGLLKNLVSGMSEDKKVMKEKFKQLSQDMEVQRRWEERQKSSNRRELERYLREKEEERITDKLKKIRKKQAGEMWSGKNSILKSDCNILDTGREILKEKNIFKNNKNIFKKDKGMFMK